MEQEIFLDEDLRRWLQEDIGYADITTQSILAGAASGVAAEEIAADKAAAGTGSAADRAAGDAAAAAKAAADGAAATEPTAADAAAPELVSEAVIQAKQAGVVAGLAVAARVFWLLDQQVQVAYLAHDGMQVSPGQQLLHLKARTAALLQGERLALNILQRMSGIATKTAGLVSLVADYPVRLADTRKTTPGFRQLEKQAVRLGGGVNHRFGLFDGVLIKDNHIKIAGGIGRAVAAARKAAPHTVKIEVETENLAQVAEALTAGADIIMLDNMPAALMKQAVALVDGRALTEASGGINESNIKEAAASGVDVISLGALTHSAGVLDISLDIGTAKPLA